MTHHDDRTTAGAAAGPLWADGRIALRIERPDGPPGRVVAVDRAYALIGRAANADLRIEDPDVSSRHTYLHLDERGLYVVDLATRLGTRVGPSGRPCGWAAPGQSLEVAGRYRVEIVSCSAGGRELPADPPPADDDPLSEAGPIPLVRVTLFPARTPAAPLVLGSELVFLGRSPACGVRVEAEGAARIHCVLARGPESAHVVDLVGRGTWINDRPLRGATPLRDGDALMIGSERYEVRLEPAWARRHAAALQPIAGPDASTSQAVAVPATLELPPLPAGVAPEGQAALMAWMMDVVQSSQAEILRQQAEFQRSLLQVVRQIHLDNTALLSKHIERVEALHREIAGLRDEIHRRFGPAATPPPPRATPPSLPAAPQAPPLRVSPLAPSTDSGTATRWLLDRVSRLEQESRSTWRDLMGRLSPPDRRGR